LRIATKILVAYDTDVDLALKLLEQAAASVARVAKTPPPQGYMLRFEADGFELELGFWISDPENGRTNVLSDVNRAIWKLFRAHQVQVPYPQREVRIIDSSKTRMPAVLSEISVSGQ
jgi:small-conductance mechanosensitive channel